MRAGRPGAVLPGEGQADRAGQGRLCGVPGDSAVPGDVRPAGRPRRDRWSVRRREDRAAPRSAPGRPAGSGLTRSVIPGRMSGGGAAGQDRPDREEGSAMLEEMVDGASARCSARSRSWSCSASSSVSSSGRRPTPTRGSESWRASPARSCSVTKLAELVTSFLSAHRAEQDRERQLAAQLWQEGGWVFTSPIGRPLSPSTDYHEWKRLLPAPPASARPPSRRPPHRRHRTPGARRLRAGRHVSYGLGRHWHGKALSARHSASPR